MSKKGGGQQSTLDPATYQQMQASYKAAQDAASQAGTSPYLNQARNFYSAGLSGANMGMGALMDPSQMKGFMNPGEQGLIDATNANYDYAGKQASQQVDSSATMAGAFGGSRAAVAQGEAAADIARQRATAVGGIQYQTYNDAVQRAMGMANFGMGAGQSLAGLDPATMRANILRQSIMPYGQQVSQGSPGSGFLGGAGTGALVGSKFGPAGALIGGGIGGIAGLFG